MPKKFTMVSPVCTMTNPPTLLLGCIQGCTKPWLGLYDNARELNAARREYEIHQDHYDRNSNRLEAYLSRHWSEVSAIVDLDNVTLAKFFESNF